MATLPVLTVTQSFRPVGLAKLSRNSVDLRNFSDSAEIACAAALSNWRKSAANLGVGGAIARRREVRPKEPPTISRPPTRPLVPGAQAKPSGEEASLSRQASINALLRRFPGGCRDRRILCSKKELPVSQEFCGGAVYLVPEPK